MDHGKTGLRINDAARATPGYTLFTPLGLNTTHLIDMKGDVVHQWTLPSEPGNYAYLLANGNLLAGVRTDDGPQRLPAKGGRLVELDWNSNVVWEHLDNHQHHDFRRCPNGNTIYLRWELLPDDVAKRVPGGIAGKEHADGMYADCVTEVSPTGQTVWEWHAISEMDVEKYPIYPTAKREEYCHGNTVCPLPNGDVIINWRYNNTMVVVDRQNKQVKWDLRDLSYGQQHDVQKLENGNILFFANGALVQDQGPEAGSRIIEIDASTKQVVWQYRGTPPHSFFSWFLGGVQRLSSGNTLICEGAWGRIFEVTPQGETVWEYVSPYFVDKHPAYTAGNYIFRVYRYAAGSPEIAGRLPADPS
jgi:hypothetical protein